MVNFIWLHCPILTSGPS